MKQEPKPKIERMVTIEDVRIDFPDIKTVSDVIVYLRNKLEQYPKSNPTAKFVVYLNDNSHTNIVLFPHEV